MASRKNSCCFAVAAKLACCLLRIANLCYFSRIYSSHCNLPPSAIESSLFLQRVLTSLVSLLPRLVPIGALAFRAYLGLIFSRFTRHPFMVASLTTVAHHTNHNFRHR